MKVRIPEPCTENWNEMTPQEQGRHCAKCDKVVVDFTKMDDHGILSHFNSNNNTCGRFQHWQMEKELTLPTLHNPWTKWIKNAAFSSCLFGGALTAKSQTVEQSDSLSPKTEISPTDSTAYLGRMVSGVIHQPEDSSNHLRSLHFSIDSFQLSVTVDTNMVSFVIPDSIMGDSLSIQAITDSTTTSLVLPILKKDTTTFELFYNFGWTFSAENVVNWNAIFDTKGPFRDITSTITVITGSFATTGFTTLETTPETAIPLITSNQLKATRRSGLNIVSGSSLSRQTQLDNQRIQQTNKASKDLIVYNKRKSSVWWWLLPIPLLLFFAGYYWKKKQLELID